MSEPLSELEFHSQFESGTTAEQYCRGLVQGFLYAQPFPLERIRIKANAVTFVERLAFHRIIPPAYCDRVVAIVAKSLDELPPAAGS